MSCSPLRGWDNFHFVQIAPYTGVITIMDRKQIYKWEIFFLGSLIFPAPWYAGMAAGTAPLLLFIYGSIAAIFGTDPDYIIYVIFLPINAAILYCISHLLTKLLLKLKPSVAIHGALVATCIALSFVPWHLSFGVNGMEVYSTIGFYQVVWGWILS